MKETLLVQVIRMLTRPQLKSVRRWLTQNTANPRPEVERLFDYLVDIWPFVDTSKLNKQQAWAAAHPNQPFDDKQLRYTISFCYQGVKEWLAWEQFSKQPAQVELHTARALYRLGLHEAYESELTSAVRVVQKQPLRNAEYLRSEQEIRQLQYESQTTRRRSDATGIAESAQSLTVLFIAERLRQACAAVLHHQLNNLDYQPHFLAECLALATTPPFVDQPAVATYYYGYLAISQFAPEHLDALRGCLARVGELFPPNEGRDIFLFAINCCILQINQGHRNYLSDVLDLYQSGLQQGVFMENGRLSRFTFNNIVVAAIGLDNYEWAEQFITDYQQYIEPAYRKDAVTYNLALLAYRRRDYPTTMSLLQQLGKDDLLHQLDARKMLLRIYFDLREFDALESLLDSLKTFIYRRKDIGYHRNHYLNLIRFVRTLIGIAPSDIAAFARLRAEIEETTALAERAWLLAQLPKG